MLDDVFQTILRDVAMSARTSVFCVQGSVGNTGIFVCLGCHTEHHRLDDLNSQTHFLTVLEVEDPNAGKVGF